MLFRNLKILRKYARARLDTNIQVYNLLKTYPFLGAIQSMNYLKDPGPKDAICMPPLDIPSTACI
jgi:hypothetical protein